ncbi:RHS repeat-associated core domain-containing protein [Pseudomonas sp. RC10]|uniref:RHS repeat-associated core domain-containing protein n=1 Tax=Pseudomonas bambusae TaxID=3139142 RepID=UPI003138A6C9
MPNSSVHTHTPRLTVQDPRGAVVRTIEWCRAASDDGGEIRPARQRFDAAGRHVASQDSRLGQASGIIENRVDHLSLSGAGLASRSVDSGSQINLPGSAGEPCIRWDGRGNVRHTLFDELLRPVVVSEQSPEGIRRVVERMTYGGADEHGQNGCGCLTRHDDMAGSLSVSDYGLTGKTIVEQWRFLAELDDPDWPQEITSRDALLEPQAAITRRLDNALAEQLQLTDARLNTQRFAHGVDGHVREAWLQVPGAEPRFVVSQVGINALGQIERETAGNGIVTSTAYCPRDGRLLRLESALPGKPAIQHLSYQYDPLGNVTAIEDLAQSTAFFRNQQIDHTNTYVYDSLSQLIEATGFESVRSESWQGMTASYRVQPDPGQLANYREQYAYDAAGNLQTLTHVGGHSFTRRTVTSLSSNRSLQVQDDWVPGEPDIAEGFDSNGNQLELLRGQRLEWGARNQLRQVTPVTRESAADDCELYHYNSAGQRVRKVQLSQGARHLRTREVRYLPELELHVDSVGDKAWHRVHLQVGRTTLCWEQWERGTPDGVHETAARYSLSDHLNSATLELDDAGVLISQESYYPYGVTAWWVQANAKGYSFKSLRFAGKERDATGLYYYGMRYYAPWLARWINPDPGGDVDGLNRYRFVRNNPVTMTDPDGRVPRVALLYGFHGVRQALSPTVRNVLPGMSELNLIMIDSLNNAIGITGGDFWDDFPRTMDRLRTGAAVERKTVRAFLAEERDTFTGTSAQAEGLLNSWSRFLADHQHEVDVAKKLKSYETPDKQPKIMGFWRKNLAGEKGWEDSDTPTYFGLLTESPEEVDRTRSQSPAARKTALARLTWIFRNTSKLGLEWVASDYEGKPEEVFFLELLEKSDVPQTQWEDMTEQHYTRQSYKSAEPNTTAYEPITFSERRHVDRKPKVLSNTRLLKRHDLRL